MAVSSSPNTNQTYQQQQQQQQQQQHAEVSGTGNTSLVNTTTNNNNGGGGGGGGAADGQPQHFLKHDPGISIDWSPEEQSILEENLSKYASESSITKYIKIAALLPEKTVRDVAFRCRWMLKKDKRKADDQNPPKKINKKDKPIEPKSVAPGLRTSPLPPYTTPSLPLESDDGIPNEAIGGPEGQLLEQNVQIIGQIKANLAACKVQENLDLLVRFRDNIFAISNSTKDIPGIINQMPQLPVVMNMDLIEAILPKSNSQMTT